MIKKYILLICACIICIYIKGQKLTKNELIQDYNTCINYLEETHPDPYTAFGGFMKFKKNSQMLRQNITDTTSIIEFRGILSSLLSTLEDGHTILREEIQDRKKVNSYLPIDFKVSTDGLFICKATKKLESYIGAKINSINGVKLENLLEIIHKKRSVENKYGALDELKKLLSETHGLEVLFPNTSQLELEVTLLNKKIESLSLQYSQESLEKVEYSTIKFKEENNLLFSDIFKNNGLTIGYLSWNSISSREMIEVVALTNPQQLEANLNNIYRSMKQERPKNDKKAIAGIPSLYETFGKLLYEMKAKNTKYLIIDLRKNGGGMTPLCKPLLYMLYGDKYLSYNSKAIYNRRISPLYLKKIGLSSIDDYNKQFKTNYILGDFSFGYFFGNPKDDRPIEQKRNDPTLISYHQNIGIEYTKRLNGTSIHEPHVIILTSPTTFSAAYHFMYLLTEVGKVTIVGVPSKQAGNTFMETTDFELPNSHIRGSISNSIQIFYPKNPDKGKTYIPDFSMSWEDFSKYNFDKNAEILFVFDLIKDGKIK